MTGCGTWRTNWSGCAAKRAGLQERWKREKNAINRVSQLKKDQEQARLDEEKATRLGEWETASQLKYGKLAEIERDLASATKELEAIKIRIGSAEGRDR